MAAEVSTHFFGGQDPPVGGEERLGRRCLRRANLAPVLPDVLGKVLLEPLRGRVPAVTVEHSGHRAHPRAKVGRHARSVLVLLPRRSLLAHRINLLQHRPTDLQRRRRRRRRAKGRTRGRNWRESEETISGGSSERSRTPEGERGLHDAVAAAFCVATTTLLAEIKKKKNLWKDCRSSEIIRHHHP